MNTERQKYKAPPFDWWGCLSTIGIMALTLIFIYGAIEYAHWFYCKLILGFHS